MPEELSLDPVDSQYRSEPPSRDSEGLRESLNGNAVLRVDGIG